MTIGKIGHNESLSTQINMSRVSDTESKGLQNQISVARQQLEKLSTNQEMTVEEKKQKRQEIQNQISELNRELRQRQAELRREQLQESGKENGQAQKLEEDGTKKFPGQDEEKENEKETNAARQEKEEKVILPYRKMEAILTAKSVENQAGTQERVVSDLTGRARIVQSEIAQDAGRGQETERKEEALEELERRAARASEAQMGFLTNAAQQISKTGWQDGRRSGQQEKKDDTRVAAMAGLPQKEAAKEAINSYHAGKRYSSVTFHV